MTAAGANGPGATFNLRNSTIAGGNFGVGFGAGTAGSIEESTISGNTNLAVGLAGNNTVTIRNSTITNNGTITTSGERAYGIFAESVGGGGGQGGSGGALVGLGGSGAGGGNAGAVEVINNGTISATGVAAVSDKSAQLVEPLVGA